MGHEHFCGPLGGGVQGLDGLSTHRTSTNCYGSGGGGTGRPTIPAGTLAHSVGTGARLPTSAGDRTWRWFRV